MIKHIIPFFYLLFFNMFTSCKKHTLDNAPYDYHIYVANFNSNSISVVDYSSKSKRLGSILSQQSTGKQPVCLQSFNGYLFVGNWGADTVEVFEQNGSSLIFKHSISVTKPHYFLLSKFQNNNYLIIAQEVQPGSISSWKIESDGNLTQVNSIQVSGRVSWLSSSPDKTVVYANSRESEEIFSISISNTGVLTKLNNITLPNGSEPYAMETHNSKKMLLVAAYSTSKIFSINLNIDGSLTSTYNTYNLPNQTNPRAINFSENFENFYVVSSSLKGVFSLNLNTLGQLSDGPKINTMENPRYLLNLPGDGRLVSVQNGIQLFSLMDEKQNWEFRNYVSTGDLIHNTTFEKK